MEKIIPIFVGGCPRSGTTFTASYLSRIQNSVAPPEALFLYNLIIPSFEKKVPNRIIIKRLKKNIRFKLWDLDISKIDKNLLKAQEIREFMFLLLNEYAKKNNFKNKIKYWIEHSPCSIENSIILSKYFKKGIFIHVIRDPKSTISSVLKLHWGPNTVYEACNWYNLNVLSAERAIKFLSEKNFNVFTLKFEELLKNPDSIFNTIKINDEINERETLILTKYTTNQHKNVGKLANTNVSTKYKNSLKESDLKLIKVKTKLISYLYGYENELIKETIQRPFFEPFEFVFKKYINLIIHRIKLWF